MNTGKVRASLLMVTVLVGTGGCAAGGGSPASTSVASQGGTASVPVESSSPGTGSSTAGSATVSLTIKDFAYGTPITVSPGAMVTVTNMDTAGHTVTADEGSAFDVDVKGSGGTATFTAPSKPGTYAYHCTYHPGMHGTLTVK